MFRENVIVKWEKRAHLDQNPNKFRYNKFCDLIGLIDLTAIIIILIIKI